MATTFYHGLNIHWGTGAATSTAFGASSVIQSIDVEQKSDEQEVKNQYGSTVGWVGYDAKKEGSFEYVAADAAAAAGNAAITQPAVGDKITISGGDTNINGTAWIVKGVTQKEMNSDCTKISVKATNYPLIT